MKDQPSKQVEKPASDSTLHCQIQFPTISPTKDKPLMQHLKQASTKTESCQIPFPTASLTNDQSMKPPHKTKSEITECYENHFPTTSPNKYQPLKQFQKQSFLSHPCWQYVGGLAEEVDEANQQLTSFCKYGTICSQANEVHLEHVNREEAQSPSFGSLCLQALALFSSEHARGQV